jgi:hypothetical protein
VASPVTYSLQCKAVVNWKMRLIAISRSLTSRARSRFVTAAAMCFPPCFRYCGSPGDPTIVQAGWGSSGLPYLFTVRTHDMGRHDSAIFHVLDQFVLRRRGFRTSASLFGGPRVFFLGLHPAQILVQPVEALRPEMFVVRRPVGHRLQRFRM